MKNKKEVVDRLNELRTHVRECWGFVWKNDADLAFASEEGTSDDSFHYFKDDCFCLWDIDTYRYAEDLDSIAPFFDDNEEDDVDWSCDLYFTFCGGKELLVSSYTVGGSLGFLLEVKGKGIQTQDVEEIKAYFAENQ